MNCTGLHWTFGYVLGTRLLERIRNMAVGNREGSASNEGIALWQPGFDPSQSRTIDGIVESRHHCARTNATETAIVLNVNVVGGGGV